MHSVNLVYHNTLSNDSYNSLRATNTTVVSTPTNAPLTFSKFINPITQSSFLPLKALTITLIGLTISHPIALLTYALAVSILLAVKLQPKNLKLQCLDPQLYENCPPQRNSLTLDTVELIDNFSSYSSHSYYSSDSQSTTSSSLNTHNHEVFIIDFGDSSIPISINKHKNLIIKNFQGKSLYTHSLDCKKLSFFNCPNIRELPKLFSCQSLSIQNCPNLKNLSINLPEYTDIFTCKNLLSQGNCIATYNTIYIEQDTLKNNPYLFLDVFTHSFTTGINKIQLYNSVTEDIGGVTKQVISSILKAVLNDTLYFEKKNDIFLPKPPLENPQKFMQFQHQFGCFLSFAFKNNAVIGSCFPSEIYLLITKLHKLSIATFDIDISPNNITLYLKLISILFPHYKFHYSLFKALDNKLTLSQENLSTLNIILLDWISDSINKQNIFSQFPFLKHICEDNTDPLLDLFKKQPQYLFEAAKRACIENIINKDHKNRLLFSSIIYLLKGFLSNIPLPMIENLSAIELQNEIEGIDLSNDLIASRFPWQEIDLYDEDECNSFHLFITWLSTLTPIQQQAFICALTGSPKLHSETEISLAFQNREDSFPTSQTCFNKLFLPKYTSLADGSKKPIKQNDFFKKMNLFLDQFTQDSLLFGLA